MSRERTSIEKLDGRVLAERRAPKDSFAGHQMSTPWDELHRAYFNGEALWTYLTTPFLLAGDGESRKWRRGRKGQRLGGCYVHTSQVQSKHTALFRTFTLAMI